MSYKIEKGLSGKRVVAYRCPNCQEPLKSPLEDAGNHDKCPICQQKLVVPGEPELIAWHKEQEAEQQRVEREKERMERERLAEVQRKAAAQLAADIQAQAREREKAAQRAQERARLQHRRQALGKSALTDAADRFLGWAFSFGKVFSILVIVVCLAVAVFAGLRLCLVTEPLPRINVPPIQVPLAANYPLFQSTQNSDSSSASNNQGTTGVPQADNVDPLQQKLNAILAQYDPDNTISDEVDHDYLECGYEEASAFISGLEKFIGDAKARNKQIDKMAIKWYADTFQQQVDAANKAQEMHDREIASAREAAASQRVYLVTIIGGAVAGLLSFLFLPLLIQIEFNTRRLLEYEATVTEEKLSECPLNLKQFMDRYSFIAFRFPVPTYQKETPQFPWSP